MGASRKLQGEIDRVLKKVQEGVDVFDSIWNKVYDTENANQKEKFEADLKKEIKKLQRYRDQIKTWIQSSEIKDKKALMDARKLIEREMERFKVCEKETKTKAFSKEGLGQQPKTDPKEKAKSETRDWLNNVVGDLENQIDNFEAEVEGFSAKKGKTKNPRLAHLETSIGRHKAHIMKLELILRLLDNDELSPDQVNDLKEFLEDYVECNQDDFERFDDVDGFYSSLPLEVEALEDLVALPSGLAKGALSLTSQQTTDQDQREETASQDSNSEIAPKTPPSKTGATGSLVSTPSPSPGPGTPTGPNPPTTPNASARPLGGGPSVASALSSPVAVQGIMESATVAASPSLANSNSVKEDDNSTFPGRRPSPAIPEIGLGRGINRGISSQAAVTASTSSASGISSNGAFGSVSAVSDMNKRNILTADERMGSGGAASPLMSPLSNRMLLQQAAKSNDGTNSNDTGKVGEVPVIGGRVFSPSVASGAQWRPPSTAALQNSNETLRGRPEIAPDQREKFLQRLQQVQQQGHNTLLSVPHLSGANQKQFPLQQQNSLLQQFHSQSSSLSPQLGLGLNMQSGFNSASSAQLQTPTRQQSSQHPLISTSPKDSDMGHPKGDEQQPNLSDDMNVESTENSSLNKIISDENSKSPYMIAGSAGMTEGSQVPRDTDLSPGQPLQPSQSSTSLGVIGRRSVSDLGAIGDNLSGSAGNSGIMHDQIYNMQMLEAAFYKLPQPKDSERAKTYVPRQPAVTPSSFPQAQHEIVQNPAFWERMGLDPLGSDTLFFSFYYQQSTYQQYLAAKELKRQSWRYHKKYNTWFQRHEEPKVTNDEYEKGTYVYFDFHIADEGPQHGWCQRIKTEFTFEYNYLEDELVV